MFPDLHFPKDNRIILAIYAALTGLGGMIVMGWGPMWFGTAALARIFGAMLVATGCWAATLSQMDDPELRRKGVHWFAAGHCILLLVLRLQFAAMGRPDLYDVLSPEFLIVMLLLGHSESYFVDKNRLPKTTIGKIAATERLRTGYE